MLLWDKGTIGGKKKRLAGLTKRRKDERLLFLQAI
jgi:GH24 family phage-related lysozyme (muramidase)